MLRSVDRVVYRVEHLGRAVRFYTDVLGLELARSEPTLAILRLPDTQTEIVLHTDQTQPAEAVFYLVDDVRGVFRQREQLGLRFVSPPRPAARGYRAVVRDPSGVVLHLIDRVNDPQGGQIPEDGMAGISLFPDVQPKPEIPAAALIELYRSAGRTADDLPYTPHFESIYERILEQVSPATPSRSEVWTRLLSLRKAGRLPRLGEARSRAPSLTAQQRERLRELLGDRAGRRDRLPYTPEFESLVETFNRSFPRRLSPHQLWRALASLVK
jgi:catechol 2,3-dioxygenase-like lactoylglutathione lyase family enzyme